MGSDPGYNRDGVRKCIAKTHDWSDSLSLLYEKSKDRSYSLEQSKAWLYLAGCVSLLEQKGFAFDTGASGSKQCRYEWRKVAKFANILIKTTFPLLGEAAYHFLDAIMGAR
ncbi:hypothetical protein ANO11243_067710 [Dothideomycetidae sp. 11243]|nr:hypothetical protein ANO11243_067710 [fungal sp. No.11243]